MKTAVKEQSGVDRFADELVPYLIGVGAALAAAGLMLALLGKNVPQGFAILLTASFGSATNFGLLILKFIPLLLMSLGFSIPLIVRKFNVGVEGQFLLGAVGAVAVGLTFSNGLGIASVPVLLLASIAFGMFWAFIPAILLYRFKVNEIVSTILMNFISFYLVLWVATGPWRDQFAGHPETRQIPGAYFLPLLSSNPEVSVGLVIAAIIPFLAYYYIYKSVQGFELRSAGANARASYVFGVNSSFLAPFALVIGGGLAGLGGGLQVAGLQLRLVDGMQSNYGALSTIIALIAGGNPLGVIVSTLFISVIDVGGSAMNAIMGVPVEMVYVIEALLLLFILMANVYRRRRR
ncbi:MAG TPA: ABC transporter permease [Conexivisphaerales archaeon]|nr:ABC transporter permease [Conexivisphaerales archaeon]